MHRFEWDALRVGDSVVVHDDDDHSYALHRATVALVDVRRGEANGVVVRYADHRPNDRPRRRAVHLSPFDRGEECWRCRDGR